MKRGREIDLKEHYNVQGKLYRSEEDPEGTEN